MPPPGPSLTERIFAEVDALMAAENAQASGAGGRTTFAAFKAADEQWLKLRTQPVRVGWVLASWLGISHSVHHAQAYGHVR